MQFETLFDINDALPDWRGLPFGLVVAGLFVAARYRPKALENVTTSDRIADAVQPFLRPRFLWRYLAPLLRLLVLTITAFALVMAPRWRWGAGIGAAIFAVAAYQYYSGFSAILALRNVDNPQIVEGAISNPGRRSNSGGFIEYFDVAGRHFSYRQIDPGTPYPLINGPLPFRAGQQARISFVGDRIVRVERQLCLIYPRCTVHYFLWLRTETAT